VGVSVGGGKGGGRGRNGNFELNLVPFIDLLSVCITFLLSTAVLIEIHNMELDQAVQDPNQEPPPIPDPPPPPPLTVHMRSDGIWVGRKVEEGMNFPKNADEYDWVKVEAEIEKDRGTYPDEDSVVLVTDDGVEYGTMIHALDITRKYEYEKSLLAGGPARGATLPPPGAPN
jgi:biopolymer transport protein ExbD